MLTETGARIFPSNYLLSNEKHTSVKYKGDEYVSRQRSISSSLLGEGLGKCSANGFIKSFNAYKINGVSEKNLIALAMDDGYYVYRRFDSEQPETLGELLDTYSLDKTLPFEKFSAYDDGYNDKGYYKIADDDYIWQVLSKCRDAKIDTNGDRWTPSGRNYLSFTATSEALGTYKKAFYITEDGYIWTNVFEYAYVYFIGETAANDIITYAKNNSTETKSEPYEYSLDGIISEIGDGYIMIDNTALCADPEDGMVFKVLTEDLRIRRYLECWNFNVGDAVSVKFQNEILIGEGNTVDNAISMHKGIIAENDLLIPE
jgi:hypothetical protein